jgi:hypothetical protein
MPHTLVSTYDNFPAAENARDALLASGFPSPNVFLSSQQDEAGPVAGNFILDVQDKEHGYTDLGDTMGGQAKPADSPMNQEAAKGASYLLMVDADDPADLSRASDIVSRYGAVEVSRRTAIGKGDEA